MGMATIVYRGLLLAAICKGIVRIEPHEKEKRVWVVFTGWRYECRLDEAGVPLVNCNIWETLNQHLKDAS